MSTWWCKFVDRLMGRVPYSVTLEFCYPEGDTGTARMSVMAVSTLDAVHKAIQKEQKSECYFEQGYDRVNATVEKNG